MSNSFAKKWGVEPGKSIFGRVVEAVRPGPGLRERLIQVSYRISSLKSRLEQEAYRLQQRDKELFGKCVDALSLKDDLRAKMYAAECAEVRKVASLILRSQLALEQVHLRLQTIQEFGDIAAVVAPVSKVVNAIRGQLLGVMPQVSYELSEVNETLNSIMIDAGVAVSGGFEVEASGEAQNILKEAYTVAEQRMKEKFPEIPAAAEKAAAEKNKNIQ
jgi:division protein CdvB (Snf7/Vps24/ESCRT-III family)